MYITWQTLITRSKCDVRCNVRSRVGDVEVCTGQLRNREKQQKSTIERTKMLPRLQLSAQVDTQREMFPRLAQVVFEYKSGRKFGDSQLWQRPDRQHASDNRQHFSVSNCTTPGVVYYFHSSTTGLLDYWTTGLLLMTVSSNPMIFAISYNFFHAKFF